MLACSVFITFGLSQNSRDILTTISHTLSIPEAGETAEAPVKRYCNTG